MIFVIIIIAIVVIVVVSSSKPSDDFQSRKNYTPPKKNSVPKAKHDGSLGGYKEQVKADFRKLKREDSERYELLTDMVGKSLMSFGKEGTIHGLMSMFAQSGFNRQEYNNLVLSFDIWRDCLQRQIDANIEESNTELLLDSAILALNVADVCRYKEYGVARSYYKYDFDNDKY